jgi:hypothetical protein
MGFALRTPAAEQHFSSELSLDAIGQSVPMETIESVLKEHQIKETRQRKLNMVSVVLLVIAMNLYTRRSIGSVMKKISFGLRYIWPEEDISAPNDSAICYRRYQLGVQPMVELFHRVCQPMATQQTPGANLFGLRAVAIDGTVEDVADTDENVRVFGRYSTDENASPFPQAKVVYLVECGTHAIIDAGLWPCRTSERVGGFRMLRSIEEGMLVMWDRGLHDYQMIHGVRKRKAHVLSRLPGSVKPRPIRWLKDRSYIAYLTPKDYSLRDQKKHWIKVRIIEYTITQAMLPGYGEVHRLVTTLLDPEAYPALDLACAYHERWEIEMVIDEMDTHQRLASRPFRSLLPVGVIQEFYGMLIAHYAVRFLMHQAAIEAGIDPDRLSFVNALHVIKDSIPFFQITAKEQLPSLYARMLSDIAKTRLPKRRFRSNPRVVKRRCSKFARKREQHYGSPQPKRTFRLSVGLI